MSSPATFRTKTGRCEIWPDRVILVRTGLRGWLAGLLQQLRGGSEPSQIRRDQIVSIEPHAPVRSITRGHFWVHYRDGREAKRRIILLPGSLSGGEEEYHKALQLFISAGLLPRTAPQP